MINSSHFNQSGDRSDYHTTTAILLFQLQTYFMHTLSSIQPMHTNKSLLILVDTCIICQCSRWIMLLFLYLINTVAYYLNIQQELERIESVLKEEKVDEEITNYGNYSYSCDAEHWEYRDVIYEVGGYEDIQDSLVTEVSLLITEVPMDTTEVPMDTNQDDNMTENITNKDEALLPRHRRRSRLAAQELILQPFSCR
ncbi:hypothetical protein BDB01DRAFT_286465 [Pilobolus umbonatus]|nr:hypothetical protein BDB01DRAFT_286465 [Pilobolus umbonatus]